MFESFDEDNLKVREVNFERFRIWIWVDDLDLGDHGDHDELAIRSGSCWMILILADDKDLAGSPRRRKGGFHLI